MALTLYLLVTLFAVQVIRVGPRAVSWPSKVVLVLAPLSLCGPAMIANRVLAPIDLAYEAPPLSAHQDLLGTGPRSPGVLSDVYCQMIPWRAAVRRAYASGEWPLWNPTILAGDVLAAAGQPAALSPLNLLEMLIPVELSFSFGLATTLFLAAFGAFLFLRLQGYRDPASVFGAIAWSWSGFLMFWLHWPQARSAAMYPWVLLGVHLVVRRPGPASCLSLTGGLALLLLSGHPETALHVVAFGSLYGIALLSRVRARRGLVAIRYALLAGLVAGLLTSAYTLPLVSAIRESFEYVLRAHGTEPAGDLPLLEASMRLLGQVAPFTLGIPGRTVSTAPATWSLPGSSYLGSVCWSLVVIGVLLGRIKSRPFVFCSLLLGLGAGVSFPPFASALARLPLFSITLNERMVFGAAFALAWLAAAGLDLVIAAGERNRGGAPEASRYANRWRSYAGISLVPLLGLLLLAVGVSGRFDVPASSAWSEAATLFLFALLATSVLLASRRARTAAVLLVALLLLQRWLECEHFYPSFPRAAFYPRVAPLDAIPEDGPIARVTALGYTWIPNTSTIYGLEDPRGYEAVTNLRFAQTFPLWSVAQPVWFNRIDSLSSPFLRFLNVQYALVPEGYPLVKGWTRRGAGSGVEMWENTRAAERFFLPKLVLVGSETEPLAQTLLSQREFVRRVSVQPLTAPAPREPIETRNGWGRVTSARAGSGYVVRANLGAPAWVASSITFWGGWRATRDGEALPLAFINHAFLGFLAPAGESTIQVRYEPRAFSIGLVLSGCGAALVAVLMGLHLFRDKKRSLLRAR